jgi:hypothetical protein
MLTVFGEEEGYFLAELVDNIMWSEVVIKK